MGWGKGWEGNGIFEDCLIEGFSEIKVEFNFDGGRANLTNHTNFSGNLTGSTDSTKDCKL